MKVVADASCIVVWNFPDEYSKASQKLSDLVENDDEGEIIISDLTYYEVGNAMNIGIRRGRTTPEEALKFMDRLVKLNFRTLPVENYSEIFEFCKKYNLTFYDASYLQLAKQESAILASNDSQLNDAAKSEKIAILAEL